MAAENLKGNVDKRRQRDESSSSSDAKIDKMTKMIDSLSSEVSRKGRVNNTFAPPNPNLYKRLDE